MKWSVWFVFYLCFSIFTYAYAYSDYDVDGVEDSIDECPNTPFDVLVNEKGCEEGKTYYGTLTLLTGLLSATNSNGSEITNAQFFMNYRYEDWDFSLSTFNDIKNSIENVPSTYYVTTGYRFALSETLQSKITLGTKQSSLQNDYFLSTNIDYSVSQKQNFFLFYSYTIAENSNTTVYDNFHTLSLGTGRILTSYWYSALSYDFSEESLANSGNYKAISWSNTFVFASHYFVLTNYSYGLSTATSEHTVSLQLGVKFE